MRRRRSSALMGIAVLILAGTGCSANTGGGASGDSTLESMEPIQLTVSDSNTETAAHGAPLRAYLDEIEERSGGKITFEVFSSSSLHPGSEAVTAVESGLTDITYLSAVLVPDSLPKSNWSTGAVTLDGGRFPQSILEGTGAQLDLYEGDTEVRAELLQHNAVPIVMWGSAQFDMLCDSPVATPEDAAGKRVATGGALWVGEVEALGMTNVAIPAVDMYEAMERGVIECVAMVPSVYETTGLMEVAKYYTPAAFSTASSQGFVIRQDLWDSFPLEVKQIFADAKAAFYRGVMEETAQRFSGWMDTADDQGIEVLDPSTLNDELAAIQEARAVHAVEDSALDDPQGYLDEYAASRDAWARTFSEELGVTEDNSGPDIESSSLPWDDIEAAFAEHLQQYRP